MRVIAAAPLTRFSESILLAAGVPAHKASVVAHSLVAANLRGVDSHGIQLLTYYIDQLLAREMDAITDGAVVTESGACMLFDGRNGIGQFVAETCCGHAIRLAGEHGVGVVPKRPARPCHGGTMDEALQKTMPIMPAARIFCAHHAQAPKWVDSQAVTTPTPCRSEERVG